LGSLRALKPSTHPVIAIFLYPLGAVKAACALEADAMGTIDLDVVEVEAMSSRCCGSLLKHLYLNISE
nr:hypothetical protein [Tanacetum cinerariifolium]